jgi:signal transduction histidine kinase
MLPEISYLVAIATACATACLMLALMHLIIWVRSGRQMTYLLSTVMVIAAGSVAIIDLLQILAPSTAEYVFWSRLMHVALFVLLISLMGFVRSYLNTGPAWLIYVVAVLWSIAVIQSFVLPNGVVHAEITELISAVTPWGEVYYIATGPVNPGKYIADAAVALILVFLGMTVMESWRRGQRERAALVAGSGALFLLIAAPMLNLQDSGILSIPLVVPSAYLIVIAALTYKLVDETFEAKDAVLEVARLRRAITLGEMVGGVTHEINQPLSAILSNAQAARRFLAESDVNLDEIREIIDDIIADNKRASGIIQVFRNMLQRKTQTDSTADVHASVRTACKLVRGDCHTSDVSLRIDLQTNYRPVLVDPIELQQVLLNLLLNAIRATAKSGARGQQVSIGCLEHGRTAEFSVADRGPGLDTETPDQLFEPFVSNNDGGLGLGLTVCRRIVERSGGRIWAGQRKGGGAVFRFTLPLADSDGGS